MSERGALALGLALGVALLSADAAAEAGAASAAAGGGSGVSGGMAQIAVAGLGALSAGALDSAGKIMAVGDRKGRVALLDLQSGRVLKAMDAHRGEVRALGFAASTLYSGGEDGRVYAWAGGGQGARRVIRRAGPPVRALAATARHLALAAEQSAIELYLLATDGGLAPRARQLEGHRGWVRALVFSPEGHRLASGGHDGKIRIWNVERRQAIRTLPAHRLWITALAFSPNGRQLASAAFDKRVYLWDIRGSKPRRRLRGHIRAVVDLAFDSSGRRLASAGLDRKALIWEVSSGRVVSRLTGHRYQVSAVAFSPVSDSLVTAAGDGFVRAWSFPQRVSEGQKLLSPPEQGVVTFRQNTTGERVRLRLVDKQGRVTRRGRRLLGRIMRSRPDGRVSLPQRRLVRLLYKVADHFGREHEVVVISGYRSPQYNRLRRKQSTQVAKESQHLTARAIDFRIEGVTITALHRYVLGLKAGGVGFYADSQFVHMDTGPVRTWLGN